MGMLFLNNIMQNNLQLANDVKCFPKYKITCDTSCNKCNTPSKFVNQKIVHLIPISDWWLGVLSGDESDNSASVIAWENCFLISISFSLLKLVLQPGINFPNVYITYQTLLLLENT